MSQLNPRFFHCSVSEDRLLLMVGPFGFVSFNTMAICGGLWGTFTCWVETPRGAWELSLGEPLFVARDPEAPPLLKFYPNA